MTPENFAYWLQGYFELLAASDNPAAGLSPHQLQCVKDHLVLVFEKVTPNRAAPEPRKRSKKKKKAKSSAKVELGILADALDKLPPADTGTVTIAPPYNPNQTRIDIDEAIKKIRMPQLDDVRTWCSGIPNRGVSTRVYC